MVITNTSDFINGLFSFLVFAITVFVGISVMLRYMVNKQKIYLYWGMFFIGMYSPWWGGGLSFLSALIFNVPLSDQMYLLVMNVQVPIVYTCYWLGFTELFFKDKRKQILIVVSVFLLIVQVYFYSMMVLDYTALGQLMSSIDPDSSPFDIKLKPLMLIFLLLESFSISISGLYFSYTSIKSGNEEVKKRGYIALYVFIMYPTIGIIDGGLDLSDVTLIIVRTILISAAIMVYLGFGYSIKKSKRKMEKNRT